MAQSRTNRGTSGGDALIGPSTRIRGRVSGDGDLTIAGQVEGDIVLRGSLTIESGGSAASNVDANVVTIAGTLEGDVNASGQVTIASGSRVRGNMRGSGVAIEDGAQFVGRLDCEFELPEGLGESAPARRR
jgi:cytoskeletal protein CcmA (bactofilin family)